MSDWQIIGLVFAVFVVIGACFLAFMLMRVTELLLTAKHTLTTLTSAALPLLEQAEQAAQNGNAGMAKVAVITDNLQAVTDNVSALTSAAAASTGDRVVRTASFSLAVRRVMTSRRHADRAKQVRAELAAERRELRRGRRSGTSSKPGKPGTSTGER